MKKNYEVALLTWASNRKIEEAKADHDLETIDFEEAISYRDAVNVAKKWSMRIGELIPNTTYELADVYIVCWYADDISEYNTAWREWYKEGKKTKRIYE